MCAPSCKLRQFEAQETQGKLRSHLHRPPKRWDMPVKGKKSIRERRERAGPGKRRQAVGGEVHWARQVEASSGAGKCTVGPEILNTIETRGRELERERKEKRREQGDQAVGRGTGGGGIVVERNKPET